MTGSVPLVALLSFALGVAVPAANAQVLGVVRGTVVDSVTGAPVAGVKVAIRCPTCYGRYPTDSLGRYLIERVPTGTQVVEFNCPSRTLLGRALAQRVVEVRAGTASEVDVYVPPGGCYEPPYSERRGVFRGHWTPGFESSKFVPCADSALGLSGTLLPGKRLSESSAWATLTGAAPHQSIQWPRHVPHDSWGNARYFVIWRGTLRGPGMYGHMGVSEFAMVVDSVLAVRAPGPHDCSREPR